MAAAETLQAAEVRTIRRDLIDPRKDQPRQRFDREPLEALAASIRTEGILTPLTVRPTAGGRYDLLAGHRRLLAAGMADLAEVPCLVRDDLAGNDLAAELLVLVDNLQRADLLPWEEGQGYRALLHRGLSVEELAAAAGHTRSYVLDRVLLTTLPESITRRYPAALSIAQLVEIARLPAIPVAPPAPDADAQNALLDAPAVDVRTVAADRVQNLPAEASRKLTDALRVDYRLPGAPAQNAFACATEVERLPVATVRARSELDARLARITGLREWVLASGADLGYLSPSAREAIAAKITVAENALRDLRQRLKL